MLNKQLPTCWQGRRGVPSLCLGCLSGPVSPLRGRAGSGSGPLHVTRTQHDNQQRAPVLSTKQDNEPNSGTLSPRTIALYCVSFLYLSLRQPQNMPPLMPDAMRLLGRRTTIHLPRNVSSRYRRSSRTAHVIRRIYLGILGSPTQR